MYNKLRESCLEKQNSVMVKLCNVLNNENSVFPTAMDPCFMTAASMTTWLIHIPIQRSLNIQSIDWQIQ